MRIKKCRTASVLTWLIAASLCLLPALAAAQTTAPAAPPAIVPPSAPPAEAAADDGQAGTVEGEDQDGSEKATEVADPNAKSDSNAVGADDKEKPGFFKGTGMWIVLFGAFILMYFWMGRSRRKQESKRREMLESLKKGDKVTSIGGIVGTVIEVREDEVMVKVDETNNVRMRFARWAIRGVGEEAKTEKPPQ
jgi:preprotein translocase subunit YajC